MACRGGEERNDGAAVRYIQQMSGTAQPDMWLPALQATSDRFGHRRVTA